MTDRKFVPALFVGMCTMILSGCSSSDDESHASGGGSGGLGGKVGTGGNGGSGKGGSGGTGAVTTGGSSGSGAVGGTGGISGSAGAGGGDDDAPFAAQRAACAFTSGALPKATFGSSIANAQIPIDTFVIVAQENRSFDHYFSELPAAGATDVDVPAKGASNPDSTGKPIARFHQTNYCFGDTNHGWDGMHKAYDNGLNDGFVLINEPGGERAMGYFDQTDLPFYYALATTYGLGDRYFCSTLTQTGPNRLYLYGATSLGTITNVGGPPGFVTIFNRLDDAGVSWGVYRNATYSYESSMFPSLYDAHPERFKSLTEFASDANADKLPHVVFTYVGPDEHPPQDMQKGQVEVQNKIFSPLSKSPAWQHAAMILTYDENGGIYDHVPPPPACKPDDIPPALKSGQAPGDFDRYGFRVPFVIASAWSKPKFVSHTVHDHTSILRLIELKFGLPALTARDANAASLLEFFDFSSPAFATPPALGQAKVDSGNLCP
jgi:phospholipase C